MKHEEDFEEFMENILDKRNSAHVNAYNNIKFVLFGSKLKSKNKVTVQPGVSKVSSNLVENQNKNRNSQKSIENVNNGQSSNYGKKGKKKFRDIRDFTEQKKEEEGRHPCNCMGQDHEFMNNCLFCGRLHCFKEGPGPCLFCGNEVTVRGESGKDSKKLMKHKLNKVFDDDRDYFKINSKKTQGSQQKLVVALDFASRRVIESTEEDERIREMLLKDSIEHLKKVKEIYARLQEQNRGLFVPKIDHGNNELVELLIQMRHKKPVEKEDLGEEDNVMPIIDYGTNVLDEELLAKMDQGVCLSMHQPYASLLVAGVKRHEGRVWPTTHRGRLWIAAAAKKPEEGEVLALEQFYREFHKDPTLKFPKDYPTSCLLGCVTVDDCLDQEAYQAQFGEHEESSSPYVMICSNPIILPLFFPMSGKHKIYPLDKELHKCAKLALQHAKYI